MGVQKEIWVDYVVDRLFKDNAFLNAAYNDDEFVLAGKVVHIPQSGAAASVTKNRSSFPATVVRRTDTEATYNLDEYTSDPAHIPDAEKYELSYDKITSIFGDHAGALVETVADDMIIKWLTGITAFVPTSGGATAATTTNQTGNRKLMLAADLRKAKLIMDLQKVPKTDRYALIESNMLDQLTQDLTATQYRDFSEYYDAEEGVVGKLFGFKIMDRPTVAMASSSDVINPLGATVLAADNVVSFCWQKNAVTRALGEKKFFERRDDPEYFGDIYSALLRAGGRRRRGDNAGVVAIKQAASA